MLPGNILAFLAYLARRDLPSAFTVSNEEFFRRLDAINKAAGKVTADDVWLVRDEMLRLYFGIGS